VDDPSSTTEQLEALTTADEAAWQATSAEILLYR